MLNERLCPSEFVSRMIVALALHDGRFPFSVDGWVRMQQHSKEERKVDQYRWYYSELFSDFSSWPYSSSCSILFVFVGYLSFDLALSSCVRGVIFDMLACRFFLPLPHTPKLSGSGRCPIYRYKAVNLYFNMVISNKKTLKQLRKLPSSPANSKKKNRHASMSILASLFSSCSPIWRAKTT